LVDIFFLYVLSEARRARGIADEQGIVGDYNFEMRRSVQTFCVDLLTSELTPVAGLTVSDRCSRWRIPFPTTAWLIHSEVFKQTRLRGDALPLDAQGLR
jgi:hypothetical protein